MEENKECTMSAGDICHLEPYDAVELGLQGLRNVKVDSLAIKGKTCKLVLEIKTDQDHIGNGKFWVKEQLLQKAMLNFVVQWPACDSFILFFCIFDKKIRLEYIFSVINKITV